jgi:hypothetical protein
VRRDGESLYSSPDQNKIRIGIDCDGMVQQTRRTDTAMFRKPIRYRGEVLPALTASRGRMTAVPRQTLAAAKSASRVNRFARKPSLRASKCHVQVAFVSKLKQRPRSFREADIQI